VDNRAATIAVHRAQIEPRLERTRQAERRHPEGLFDFDAAADFLAVPPRHVRRLWQERRIAGVKVGRAVRFTEADLLSYVARQRVEAIR
jgi:excisionase family DNA binding protein